MSEISEPGVNISTHPIVKDKLTKLRSVGTEPRKFRELVREISLLLACEATKNLNTKTVSVTTPVGNTEGFTLGGSVGLVPILRAGLGMVEGVWEMMPDAVVWHIGLRRNEQTLEPVQYYANKPIEPDVQACLLMDPMLATGGSASAACKLLKSWGVSHIIYIGIIAAPEGIHRLKKDHPEVPIYLAGLDSHLNDQGYIVPGLGDAGDRQFGTA
ncbi:MAG: uracil phosphoribosyltransferase [Chloroflexi bacterium]|jgi:uracil phosphoribosyltransferase|nr:MAG: uracil phosphoribosyltransferase [Chloroflexota bacterium]